MNKRPNIKSYSKVEPKIYAYTTEDVPKLSDHTKIGYTERDVEQRIREQSTTIPIDCDLQWSDKAEYLYPVEDETKKHFTDHDFHNYLIKFGGIERFGRSEWFAVRPDLAKEYFDRFVIGEYKIDFEENEYILRDEQAEAVSMAQEYFENGGKEFLWNAKPRFGKTLTAYDLVQALEANNVLIITNRPSIANSWSEDFNKFIGWRDEYNFVSETGALEDKEGVLTREQHLRTKDKNGSIKKMIAFESLQGLKGARIFGGNYPKLEWIKGISDNKGFDLIIIDEAHEGVDTSRTDIIRDRINTKHTLHLSGTPFKALANETFEENQIFNWTYADEQRAKREWNKPENNPYAALPVLNMFTYQLSGLIEDKLDQGLDLSNDTVVDYAFDLNEFFKTKDSGKFEYEDKVKNFLHSLTKNEKYPFSTPELRDELKHTLWILNRVDSAKALAKLLKEMDEFKDYEIVLAAGDGKLSEDEESKKAYNKVKDAIASNDKTITLSVGQLTVGVTIPEWSGVFMLSNMKSPAAYMQAAFRAQNPHIYEKDGEFFRKENAYVFDFDPTRTLTIFEEFATSLSPSTAAGKGTEGDRQDKIYELLNFFPVIGEDEEGKMIELDAEHVLSIPRKLKSIEVVRHGFISNYLFRNIGNIFGAPKEITQIVEKLVPAFEEVKKNEKLPEQPDIILDDNGDVKIDIGTAADKFGEKVYEVKEEITNSFEPVKPEESHFDKKFKETVKMVKQKIEKRIIDPVLQENPIKAAKEKKLKRDVNNEIDRTFNRIKIEYERNTNVENINYKEKLGQAKTKEEKKKVKEEHKKNLVEAADSFNEEVLKEAMHLTTDKPEEIIEKIFKAQKEGEKEDYEEAIRAHLRGFTRTIPSFIMAYGDRDLTLANFDDYTDDDVFEEVTGITEDEFRLLRDGGDFTSESGETVHFDGGFFDEIVFNSSVQEFLNKKEELSDYFNAENTEDIFDYIPPQRTNQIFTPKWVVKKMVDDLETENPGAFDDPDKTFADLYMKSGLYITEIVKRLFRSPRLKELFPDDKERLRHIFTKQVYGMAPTKIIYLIATNYILGFDEELKKEVLKSHFVQEDAAEAAKNGTLQELVDKHFGA